MSVPLEGCFIAAASDLGVWARKVRPQDFTVDEKASYDFLNDDAAHLCLYIERIAKSHHWMITHLVKSLKVSSGDIGYAGIKDTDAVIRQHLSIPSSKDYDLSALDVDGVFRVLQVKPIARRLRVGQLRGNLFNIILRGGDSSDYERLEKRFSSLERVGLINCFGAQRFADGANLRRLQSLLETPSKWRRLARHDRRFFVSVLQACIFNHYLNLRKMRGTLDKVLTGDVLKPDTGGLFVSEDPSHDQLRLERRELAITGPIVGHRSELAQGEARALEDEVLATLGLSREFFLQFGKLALGTRRPLRVKLVDSSCEWLEGEGASLKFFLPKGCYATAVIDTVCS